MASTYTPIATQSVSSPTTTITFSSIPSTYTDLVLVTNAKRTTTNTALCARFNSDSGTNYSLTYVQGSGTTASSGRASNVNFAYLDFTNTTSYPTLSINHIMNYSNTTTYKSFLSRNGDADMATNAYASLWRSTSAINRIDIFLGSGDIQAGSTFTLYGIKAA